MTPASTHQPQPLSRGERSRLGSVIFVACVVLAVTIGIGWRLERGEGSRLVAVGQSVPNVTLSSDTGARVALAGQQGRPSLIAFVPSMQCGACQRQLRMLQAVLPALRDTGVAVFVISTDEPEVQQTVARSLRLGYTLLAESVVVDRHPAGRAFGVFHEPGSQQGPVDASAIFVVDSAGTIRAVDNRPAGQMSGGELLDMVRRALPGGSR